jgi:hypothetical protein
MHDMWTAHEVWVYQCNRCLYTWDEEYDARHVDDGHGGEAVVYQHDGRPCMSPWCDRLCPRCGSQNVKTLATPLSRSVPAQAHRHAEDLAMLFHLRKMGAY